MEKYIKENYKTLIAVQDWYTKETFPIFIMNHGNWDIYMKPNGYCAAIARVPECLSHPYGDIKYVITTTRNRNISARLNAIYSRSGLGILV